MANQMELFRQTKQQIDAISPSYCSAKWQQVTLHLHNGRTHSCHHPNTHVIPQEEIRIDVSALHNTKYKKEQRKLMLEGTRPKECQYCWNVEDLDGYKRDEFFSDRVTKSQWMYGLQNPNEHKLENWNRNVNPVYVEVSFSNLCNFKCSYCSPVYSSKWTEEIERHGPYPTSGNFNNLDWYRSVNEMPIHHSEHNPYVEAFWAWWPELVKTLKVFRITGGEPLLNKDTYKVLDYLYDNPQPNLEFAINTNGCIPDKLLDQFISSLQRLIAEGKIGNTHIYTSIDGWGTPAEYGRNGLDFEQWKKTVDRFLLELPSTKLSIMCTTNVFSIPGFQHLMEFIYSRKIGDFATRRTNIVTIDTTILRYPLHQNLAIVTDDLKITFDETLEYMRLHEEGKHGNPHYLGFFDFEIARLERLIEFVKSKNGEMSEQRIQIARADFYKFVNEHDKRRGTDFLATFPQLESFYRICEQAAQGDAI